MPAAVAVNPGKAAVQAKKVGRTAANVDRIGSLGFVFSRLLFKIVRFIAGFQN